ncbi:MAG: hypothetical protein PF440_01450 [Thiomicrorhabdus sp.]|jgi:hypothetical protein|nr:hypothetical protein [Thiomicrorhabdus sp.]
MSNKYNIPIPQSVILGLTKVITEQPDELVDRLSVFLYSKAAVAEGRLLQSFLLDEISKYKKKVLLKPKKVDGHIIEYVIDTGDIEVLTVNNVEVNYISENYVKFLESELSHMVADDMADAIQQEADFRYSQIKEES